MTYRDNTVHFGASYQYRVIATNTEGDAVPTLSLSVATPLAPPGSVRAYSISGHETDLTWVPPVGETISSFKVYQSTDPAVLGSLINTVTANNHAPTAPVAYAAQGSFTPSTNYYYTIRAVGPSGESLGSTASVMTGNFPTAPSAITFDEVTSKYRLSLHWLAGANQTGYRVYRRSAGVGWELRGETLAQTSTSYVDTVSPGFNYQYRVVAINSARESAFAISTSKASLLADPNAPKRLTVKAGNDINALDLSWDDHSTNEIGYQIQRAPFRTWGWDERLFQDVPGSDAVTHIVAGPNVGGTATWRSAGLTPATTYFYRVRAIRPDGPGDWSPVSYGITSLDPSQPAPPFIAPVGEPGGAPAAGGGGELREYNFSFNNTDTYTFDVRNSGFEGSVKFRQSPILASSLSDAVTNAVIPEESSITKIFSDGSTRLAFHG